jgi:hypothetical protein
MATGWQIAAGGASGGLRFSSGSLRKRPLMFGNPPKAPGRGIRYSAPMLNFPYLRLAAFAAALVTSDARPSRAADACPPLPEAVTSFGAATQAGWLYVFGGHRGERHDYSSDQVSGALHRLRLDGGRVWESLPGAALGQGLALVAHGRFLYRVGGMAARNAHGAKQDLYSTNLVQRFDPGTGLWEEMIPMPAPRSSHDAAVLGDRLFVGGGWQLDGGDAKPVWHARMLVLDLTSPQLGWQAMEQPFQRRALAVAAAGHHVLCIGGMDSDNRSTLSVDIFNTLDGNWTRGPDLPTGPHKGFGCSAIAQDGRIYASTLQGDLLRLAPDSRSWEIVGRLRHPRLAHRLVSAGAASLIVLGGEDGEAKRPELEWFDVSARADVRPALPAAARFARP